MRRIRLLTSRLTAELALDATQVAFRTECRKPAQRNWERPLAGAWTREPRQLVLLDERRPK
jgi:hypothetical protein